MISGLTSGDYFVLIFTCAIMGTRKMVIAALDEMIQARQVNDKIKLILIYLVGFMIGNLICMWVLLVNSYAITLFLMNNITSPSNQSVIGEVIKSSVTLIFAGLIYFKAFNPIVTKLKIIIGEK